MATVLCGTPGFDSEDRSAGSRTPARLQVGARLAVSDPGGFWNMTLKGWAWLRQPSSWSHFHVEGIRRAQTRVQASALEQLPQITVQVLCTVAA
jgi:hypothetical protein